MMQGQVPKGGGGGGFGGPGSVYRSAPNSAPHTPRKVPAPTRAMSPSPSGSHMDVSRSTSRNVSAEKDPSRSRAIGTHVDRQYVPVTAYQPVDTITKTVEVPLVRVVETFVPKHVVEEKIVHIEKRVPHYVEKIVEVPQYKYFEKVVEVPEIQYTTKYVPKVEYREKIVECPRYEEKWVEKIVEVPQIREVVRFREVVAEEEVIKYVPNGQSFIDWEAEYAKFLQNSELRLAGEVGDPSLQPPDERLLHRTPLPNGAVETPAARTLLPSSPGMPAAHGGVGAGPMGQYPAQLAAAQQAKGEFFPPGAHMAPDAQKGQHPLHPFLYSSPEGLEGAAPPPPATRKRQMQWCCQ